MVRRCWLWICGLFLLACAPSEPQQQGPRYAQSRNDASAPRVLRLAVHPLHNPQRLLEAYGPLADYLNARLGGVRIEIEASNSYAHYEQKIRARAPELLLPNPYQTLMALEHGYRVLAEAGDSEDFRGLLIMRKDARLEQVADLRGRALAYPAPTALAAAMLPKLWLARQGLNPEQELDNRYVGSQESTLLNVYAREVAVAVTWRPPWRAFLRSHPDKAAELEVIWETPSLINNSLMIRNDLPLELADALRTQLLGMCSDPAASAVLVSIGVRCFNPADDQRYRDTLEPFLQEYQQKVGPLP